MCPTFNREKATLYEPYILSREPYTEDQSPHNTRALHSISPTFYRESHTVQEPYILCALHPTRKPYTVWGLHSMSPTSYRENPTFYRERYIHKTRAHTTQEPYILCAPYCIERARHSIERALDSSERAPRYFSHRYLSHKSHQSHRFYRMRPRGSWNRHTEPETLPEGVKRKRQESPLNAIECAQESVEIDTRSHRLYPKGEVGGWGRDLKICTGRHWGMGSSTI